MKAVLGAAVAALVVGLVVGWLGHTVLYAEPDDGAQRAVLLLGGGRGPGTESIDSYVRHIQPETEGVVGSYEQAPPPGRLHPVVFVDARIACYMRLHRPTVCRVAHGGVMFEADVDRVAQPVVAAFELRWLSEDGPSFVFAGREGGQDVLFGPDGWTVPPAWCD